MSLSKIQGRFIHPPTTLTDGALFRMKSCKGQRKGKKTNQLDRDRRAGRKMKGSWELSESDVAWYELDDGGEDYYRCFDCHRVIGCYEVLCSRCQQADNERDELCYWEELEARHVNDDYGLDWDDSDDSDDSDDWDDNKPTYPKGLVSFQRIWRAKEEALLKRLCPDALFQGSITPLVKEVRVRKSGINPTTFTSMPQPCR